MVAISLISVDYTNERFWICGVLALEIGWPSLMFFFSPFTPPFNKLQQKKHKQSYLPL